MKKIETSVFSHLSILEQMQGLTVTPSYVHHVWSSQPLDVTSFVELVGHLAKVNYHNYSHCMFYRGQGEDHFRNNASSILPTIYRQIGDRNQLVRRFSYLIDASEDLLQILEDHDFINKITGLKRLNKFDEIVWAILQHYGIVPTPVLDITHSVRVAASFALTDHKGEIRDKGIFYVLGFPHIYENISFHYSEKLFTLKLLSICPPTAKRPYFQEGFSAGTFPDLKPSRGRLEPFDFRNRLIAKFRLLNHDGKFFDGGFCEIPFNSLFPNDQDDFYQMLQPLKEKYKGVK